VKMGDCRPMSARITERQCGINQERSLFSCGKCDGLVNVVDVAMGEVIVGVMAVCTRCKFEKEIVAKGLCRSCYDFLANEKRKAARTAVHEKPVAGKLSEPAVPVGKPHDKHAKVSEDVSCEPAATTETGATIAPRSLLSMITPPPRSKNRRYLSRLLKSPRVAGRPGSNQRQRARRHPGALLDAGAGQVARGRGMIGPSPHLNQINSGASPRCRRLPPLPFNQGAGQSSYWMGTGRLF